VSAALEKAIIARVRGTETLTGDMLLAQQYLVELLGADPPTIVKNSLKSKATLPCITFGFDPGPEAMGGVDVGEVRWVIGRFYIWTKARGGSFFSEVADALEHLFNGRRGASNLTLEGDDRTYWSDLFVDLQEPDHEDSTNDFYATLSFKFVEARP